MYKPSLQLNRTHQRWYDMNPGARGILALQLVITKRFRSSAPHNSQNDQFWSPSDFFLFWRNFQLSFLVEVTSVPNEDYAEPNIPQKNSWRHSNFRGLSKGFLIATLHGFFERAENRDLSENRRKPRGSRGGLESWMMPRLVGKSKQMYKNLVILRVCALFGMIKILRWWKRDQFGRVK